MLISNLITTIKNYDNIRNIVENNEQESISKPEIKNIKNKLHIV